MRMSSEGNFGTYEAICLTTLLMINKIFYTSVSGIVEILGTAAWYGTIISCIVTLFFFYLLYLLMKRFPGHNITQIFEIVLGKFVGKIVTLSFCSYMVYFSASTLREFIEMIKVYNLPYTPPSFLIFTFLIVSSIIAYYGLEGIARISAIVFIPIILGMIIILLLNIHYYDLDYLKPFLGYGMKKTVVTGTLRSSAYDEIIILAIIINSIGLKSFKKAGVLSIIITGITFTVNLICYLMAFSYTMGRENLSGLFQLSIIIYINRFIQRLESIFLFIWVVSSLIAVSIAFYIAISLYCKAFKISNHRPIILQFAFLTFMVALLPKNISEVIEINIKFLRQYSMLFVYTVPIIVLIFAIIFKKKGDITNAKKS